MRGHAVIVGAGISGLALARGLHRAGWSVRAFEQTGGLPRVGTALGMWPEAMDALAQLGVQDQVRSRSVPAADGALLKPDGGVIARLRPKGQVYLVPRPALLATLHDPDRDTVSWNHPVEDVGELLDDADVLIGADGIHSRVRTHIVGAGYQPRPLGSVAFRGTVTGAASAMSETWGAGRLFGMTAHDAQRTNWFASVREEVLAGSGDRADLDLLRELYGRWHPAVRAVLDRVAPDEIDRRVLYDVPPLPALHRGNAVIIGDAAHAMAPNLGRGACESLVDAAVLTDCLRTAGSVGQALANFDSKRRRAGSRLVRASRVMSRIATARRGTTVRDLAMSVGARLV